LISFQEDEHFSRGELQYSEELGEAGNIAYELQNVYDTQRDADTSFDVSSEQFTESSLHQRKDIVNPNPVDRKFSLDENVHPYPGFFDTSYGEIFIRDELDEGAYYRPPSQQTSYNPDHYHRSQDLRHADVNLSMDTLNSSYDDIVIRTKFTESNRSLTTDCDNVRRFPRKLHSDDEPLPKSFHFERNVPSTSSYRSVRAKPMSRLTRPRSAKAVLSGTKEHQMENKSLGEKDDLLRSNADMRSRLNKLGKFKLLSRTLPSEEDIP